MSVNTSTDILTDLHTPHQDSMNLCILNHDLLNINFGLYHKLQHFPCSIIQSVVLMTCTAQRLTKLYFNSSMCDKKTNMQWNSRLFRQPIVVFAHFSTFFLPIWLYKSRTFLCEIRAVVFWDIPLVLLHKYINKSHFEIWPSFAVHWNTHWHISAKFICYFDFSSFWAPHVC